MGYNESVPNGFQWESAKRIGFKCFVFETLREHLSGSKIHTGAWFRKSIN